jgi:DNA-binding transcriptional regulator YiaG
MSDIEEALIAFVNRHFDGSTGDIDALQDELKDLQNTVNNLEQKVDQLLDQGKQDEDVQASSKQGTAEAEEETKKKRVTKRTIKSIRDRFDLTQKQLADLLEVSSVTISSWESGNSKPQKRNKEKIIELRETSRSDVEDMLGGDPDEDETSPDIRAIRDEHGFTQKEFAKKLDVSPATVSNWEQGETNPQPDTVEQIKTLDVEEGDTEDPFTGDDIKQLRDEKGFSQSELADKLGVSAGTVSNWERGESSPGPDTIERIQNIEASEEERETLSGQEMKDLRGELDMSQSDLADRLDVSPGTVSNWETGKSQPDPDTVEKIKALGEQEEDEDTEQDKEDTDEEETTPDSTRILQYIRERFDLTQQELADLLDVTSATVGSWERGDTTPQGDNKDRILDLKDKSKEELQDELEQEESVDIRSIREELGLTRSKFADKVGVSVQTVYNWEQGQTEPGPENLENIQNLDGHREDKEETLSGDDIKDLRQEKNLSQSDLAEQLDVSAATVSNWERGKGSPSEEAVEKLQEL